MPHRVNVPRNEAAARRGRRVDAINSRSRESEPHKNAHRARGGRIKVRSLLGNAREIYEPTDPRRVRTFA